MPIPISVSQQVGFANVSDLGQAILTQLQGMDVHIVKVIELLSQQSTQLSEIDAHIVKVIELLSQQITQLSEIDAHNVKAQDLLSQKLDLVSQKIDLLTQEVVNSSMKRGFYICLASFGTLGLVLSIRRRHFHLADTLEFNDSQQNEYNNAQREWAAEYLAGILVADSKRSLEGFPRIDGGLEIERALEIVDQARNNEGNEPTDVRTNENQTISDIYLREHGTHLAADFDGLPFPEKEARLTRRKIMKSTAIKAFASFEGPTIVTTDELGVFLACFALSMMGYFMIS